MKKFILGILICLIASPTLASDLMQVRDLPELAEYVLNSTVSIEVEYPFGPQGIGSGFVVNLEKDEDGNTIRVDILTNYHVIKGARTVRARGTEWRSRGEIVLIRDFDKENDIALLTDVRPRRLYRSTLSTAKDLPRQGESVLTAGSPMGMDSSISTGIISGIRKLNDDLILLQITAPISSGSSGGPVVNMKGEVVGMSTMTLAQGQNLNFAIASPVLNRFISQAVTKPPTINFPEMTHEIPIPNERGFAGHQWGENSTDLAVSFGYIRAFLELGFDLIAPWKREGTDSHYNSTAGFFTAFTPDKIFWVSCSFYQDQFYGVTFRRAAVDLDSHEDLGINLSIDDIEEEILFIERELSALFGFSPLKREIAGQMAFFEWNTNNITATIHASYTPYDNGYTVSFTYEPIFERLFNEIKLRSR